MLDALDLSLALPKQAGKTVVRDLLDRVAMLAELVYERKRAALVVFEGWDAAGKGTTIRTLTERLDARGYKVLSTQAPRTHEKQKPWLWRFWMNIPRYGQIAIYDRSWYGRVLVERVQGLTPMPDWIAAYEEINQFERTLADDGAIIVKFWLHISRQEQLRRFIELSGQPENAWRITAEDWENHRKYDEYLAAVRDMLANTSTPYAPWTAVAATNREYRAYTVYRTLIGALERALGLEATAWPEPAALDVYDAERAALKAAEKSAKQERKLARQAAAASATVAANGDAAQAEAAGLGAATAGGPVVGSDAPLAGKANGKAEKKHKQDKGDKLVKADKPGKAGKPKHPDHDEGEKKDKKHKQVKQSGAPAGGLPAESVPAVPVGPEHAANGNRGDVASSAAAGSADQG